MQHDSIKTKQGTRFGGWLYEFWAALTLKTFRMKKRNQKQCVELRKKFKDNDWVFGIGEHKGCSQIFTGTYGDMQPFSYLNDYDPDNFRLATKDEIQIARDSV